jgi:hypothetical protein
MLDVMDVDAGPRAPWVGTFVAGFRHELQLDGLGNVPLLGSQLKLSGLLESRFSDFGCIPHAGLSQVADVRKPPRVGLETRTDNYPQFFVHRENRWRSQQDSNLQPTE